MKYCIKVVLYKKMCYTCQMHAKDVHKEISKLFARCNFPTKINGYIFLRDIVTLILSTEKNLTTSEWFYHVAEKHDVSIKNVERSIRTLIENTWVKCYKLGLCKDHPTPRTYILMIAELIQENHAKSAPSAYDILLT